jgi:class 3 adenylate cyclase/tetratricopeptide (TPR) repeat protein
MDSIPFPQTSLPPKAESEASGRNVQGERRIVTALFCDVKGSTAIAEQLDPEEWAELLNGAYERLTTAVYRYEGTVVRLLGDAILAIFGAPVAHEDDPERAVLAGLEMTEAIRVYGGEVRRRYGMEFTIRIGVNTGLVVVGAMGSSSHTDYTAVGDAVNVAARMEQTAAPGAVQIAHDTYRLVAPLFDVEDLGAIEVKGKSEPVRAYRVLRLKSQRGNRRGLPGLRAPLIGRAVEMAALQQAVDALAAGQGQIVAVMGEAGLGKSRLIAELRQTLERTGAIAPASALEGAAADISIQWLEGRSFSYEMSTPYAPFISLLTQFAGMQSGQPPAEAYAQLKTTLDRLAPQESERFAPYIAALMGIIPAGAEFASIQQLDPQQLRAGIFDAVATVVSWLANRCPTILVFEDIHWIDPTSLELLLHLLPLTANTRLMLIALFRPRTHEPSWRFHEIASRDYSERYTPVALRPLSDDNAHTLVQTLLDANDLPDHVRQLILNKAEGNPFFVEEVIRAMLDAGWLAREDGLWHITQTVEQIAVPDTLAGVITARLDRLSEAPKHVAQTASVIGRDFAYTILAEVSEMTNGTASSLESALADLQQRDLIHENHSQPQRAYRFKHVLTQETAYASLLLSRRRQLHLRVAECLERADPENVIEIARHFLEARMPERALPYFIAAGDRAARGYAAQEAIAHYSRGLEAAEQVGAPSIDLHRGRGRAHDMLGDFEAARADFEAALHLAQTAQDRQGEWQALIDLGELWAARDYAQMGSYLQQALALARTLDDPTSLAYTLNRVGNWHLNTGSPITAQGYHKEALAIFERLGDRRGLAATHDLLGLAFGEASDMADAADHLRRAIALFRQLDDRQGLAGSLSMASTMHGNGHYLLNDIVVTSPTSLEESFAYAEESLAIARAIHWRAAEAYALLNLSLLYVGRHDIEQALTHGQHSLEVAQSIQHHQWICGAHCALGGVHSVMLNLKTARRHLEEALALAQALNSHVWVHVIVGMLVPVLLLQNDLAPAHAVLDNLIQPDTPMESYGQRRCWYVRAELALMEGNTARALEIVERLYATASHLAAPEDIPPLALVHGKALAAFGRVEEADLALRQAEQGAQSRGWYPLLWQIYVTQARFFRNLGRLDEAHYAERQSRVIIEEIAAAISDDALRTNFVARALAMFEMDR